MIPKLLEPHPWMLIVVLLSASAASGLDGEEARPREWSDTFATDSLKGYKVEGPVVWAPGEVRFDPGGTVRRAVQGGATCEVTLTLALPSPEKDGETIEHRLVFVPAGLESFGWSTIAAGEPLAVAWQRRRQQGQRVDEVRILTGSPKALLAEDQRPVTLRSFPLPPLEAIDTWKVRYNHGLVTVERGDREVAIGHRQNYSAAVVSIILHQHGGAARVKELRLSASPPEPSVPLAQRLRLLTAFQADQRQQKFSQQGRFGEAIAAAREAWTICKEVLGPDHFYTENALHHLARLLEAQGDYVKAEPLYRELLEARRRTLGEKHPDYAASLHNLAELRHLQGDDAKAWPLYLQALDIMKQACGARNRECAIMLNNLASVCESQGRSSEAADLTYEAWEALGQIVGERDRDYAAVTSNLATRCDRAGRYQLAEELHAKALKTFQTLHGEKHPDTAECFGRIAFGYRLRGDYTKAVPLCQRALEIKQDVLGESHPTCAGSLDELAWLYRFQGRDVEAEPLARQCLLLTRQHLEASAAVQSERQQLAMAQSQRARLDSFLTLALKLHSPADRIAPVVFQAKGAVFVRQLRQRQLAELAGREGEAARLATELDQTSRRLAVLAGLTPPQPQVEAWKKQLAALTEKKEQLEADLSRCSEGFRAQKAREALTPDQLRERLPPEVALIDLFEYDHADPNPKDPGRTVSQQRLLATVLRRDRPIAVIPLGPVHSLSAALDQWRQSLTSAEPTRNGTAAGLLLRKQLWEPLVTQLDAVKIVLISPDGVAAKLPFAALPGSQPESSLLEEVGLAVVPVPQLLPDLLDSQPDLRVDRPSLLLVGGVDFNSQAGNLVAMQAGRTAEGTADTRSGRRLEWRELPGTDREITALDTLFASHFSQQAALVLRGGEATEATIRQQVPQHRWLHFATHGFFAPPEVKSFARRSDSKDSLLAGPEGFATQDMTGHHPGLLSGLVLSGANREPAPDQDDGILTALEVQAMELRRVDLAVLSACETGLGEIAGGEGLLGLQRAFQVAGARTVVSSLWKVNDQATQALMEEFYRNLWDKKQSKLESLRQAQLKMMREFDPKEGTVRGTVGKLKPLTPAEAAARKEAETRLPPYYWAGFVLSGDWR